MATLHMEVETARATVDNLLRTLFDFGELGYKVYRAVNNLRTGAWQGVSSQEFFNQYDQWHNHFNDARDQLTLIADSLAREITEWENAASRLSS